MLKSIVAFSANNKFLVLIFVAIAVVFAVYSVQNIPLDAIPDLSDTQVIVYSRWDRSPDIIEDQVTYPIVTAMLGAPKVKAIRGFSDFGFSYVYIIFQDGTDIYWARSRTVEYLSKILPRLPEGVKTEIGPDATGVGWVYQYALVDKTGQNDLAQLRSFQDWYLKYYIQSVPGVAEVASLGGFQKQYQVNINPNALVGYNIPLMKVVDAIRDANNDVGGRLVEFSGAEYMVRGRGYIKSVSDIENISLGADDKGTPILVKSVANVVIGPDIRRGVADLDGIGDTVGGIVVVRHGENALNVIERVKAKIEEIKPSLPKGAEIVTTYDRSELIHEAIDTLKHQLIAEMIVVSLVILLFLWHIPSALVPIITIPVAALLAFIPMWGMGLTSNIMSISGIAISIGVLVDGAIVEVENAYKKLEIWIEGGRQGDPHKIRIQALQEVAPSIFFSLLVIAVAFMPIFTLVEQEGRLFKPLAYTKNLTMAIAALLAITLDPAIRLLFMKMDYFKPKSALGKVFAWPANQVLVGKYYKEENHPVSKTLFWFYEPLCKFVLKYPRAVIATALILIVTTIPVYFKLGSEFMPPLNEGSILYMPTTLPGISVTEAQRLLQVQDKIIKSIPEVVSVFGKAGRAETSTDPAPFSMMETTVVLKPREQWRKKERWYSGLPVILQWPFRSIWPDRISWDDIINEMDSKMQFPGVVNAWTMPIKARIDMLTTGVRTPIGIKIYGADLKEIEQIGLHLEAIMRDIPGTRSVYAERVTGGYFLDFDLKREQLARYGLSVKEVEMVIMSAIGGEGITTTVEGRERYSVNVRYARELRDDLPALQRVLVPTSAVSSGGDEMSGGANPPVIRQVPLAELADIKFTTGPAMIRDENGLLAGYVYVDIKDRDVGSYVTEAKKIVKEQLPMPTGYSLLWSGQYENMLRVKERLKIVIPLTLFIIFILLYLNTKSTFKTLIVLMAVPFSLIGAIWFMYLLDYNVSIAVWVGMIALMGLDAETGVFMLLFLDLSYYDRVRKGTMKTYNDLHEAVIYGAVKRIRPKMMTVGTTFIGLIPIMWSIGTGADMMKRIAAPMVGGLFTSFIMELLVYPPIYLLWKWYGEMKEGTVDVSKLQIPELKEH
ncbi:MAG: efflux RND transporter permease subunit [Planctomycetes bacterium]|nr:efflux RND transporter permease subunit [Planctomycetota bacterium]